MDDESVATATSTRSTTGRERPFVVDPAFDISRGFLCESLVELGRAFPGLPVYPLVGDFSEMLPLPAATEHSRRLGFFPGSTIGIVLSNPFGGVMLSLEVVPLPVSDIDRALAFYREQAGFALDVDYRPAAGFRVVQLTPPGSACSVHLVATDSPSRVHGLCLVTTDLPAEREKLLARGVAVGAVRHKDPVETWAGGWSAGLDSQRRDYASFADFADLDGNTWILQERGYRKP